MIQSMWGHFCEFTSASYLPPVADHTAAAFTSTSSPSAAARRLGRSTPGSAPPSVSPTRRLDVLRRLSEIEDCKIPAPSLVPRPLTLSLPLTLTLSRDSPVFVPSGADMGMVVDGQTSQCSTEDDAATDMYGSSPAGDSRSLSSSTTSFTSLSVSIPDAVEDPRWLPNPSPGGARPTTPHGVCDLFCDDLDSDSGSNSGFSLLSTSRC